MPKQRATSLATVVNPTYETGTVLVNNHGNDGGASGGVNNYSGYEVPAGSYASHSAVGNSASIVYAVPAEDGGNGDIVDNGLSSDYSNANLTSLPLPDATQSATDIDETYGDINRTRTHSTTAGARGAVIRNNNGTDGRGAAARSSDSYAATSKGVAIDNAVLHQGLIFYKRATAALVAVSLVLLAIVLLLATRNSGGSCTTELVHGGGVAGAAAADLLAEASSDADRDHPLCGPSKAEIQCLRWLQDVVGTTNDDNNVDSNINDDKVVESSIESDDDGTIGGANLADECALTKAGAEAAFAALMGNASSDVSTPGGDSAVATTVTATSTATATATATSATTSTTTGTTTTTLKTCGSANISEVEVDSFLQSLYGKALYDNPRVVQTKFAFGKRETFKLDEVTFEDVLGTLHSTRHHSNGLSIRNSLFNLTIHIEGPPAARLRFSKNYQAHGYNTHGVPLQALEATHKEVYYAGAETGVTEKVTFKEGDTLMIGMDAPLAALKTHSATVHIARGGKDFGKATWTISTNECTRVVGSPCQGGLYSHYFDKENYKPDYQRYPRTGTGNNPTCKRHYSIVAPSGMPRDRLREKPTTRSFGRGFYGTVNYTNPEYDGTANDIRNVLSGVDQGGRSCPNCNPGCPNSQLFGQDCGKRSNQNCPNWVVDGRGFPCADRDAACGLKDCRDLTLGGSSNWRNLIDAKTPIFPEAFTKKFGDPGADAYGQVEARVRGEFVGGAGNYTHGVPFTATEIAALNLNSPAGSYYQRVSVDFSSTPFIKCDGTKCESVPDGSFGAQVFCGQPFALRCSRNIPLPQLKSCCGPFQSNGGVRESIFPARPQPGGLDLGGDDDADVKCL